MTAPYPSPEEVDAACAAARVPGAGISRMDMVAALEAAAEVREAAALGSADDGFGNVWPLCRPGCGIEVVRPGKAQCVARGCESEGRS